MYILPDTNIWLRDAWMMRSAMGAALLFAAEQLDAALVLPEVVELEIRKHVVRMGLEANREIEDAYQTIGLLVGRHDDYRVPSEDDYRAAVDSRLEEIADRVRRLPYTFDHAKNALRRVMEESPPNGPKNQQFKDSAIWEAALELASERTVHFITRDKGFFEERKPSRGLATNLQQELDASGLVIHVQEGISSFLRVVGQELPPVDEDAVLQAVEALVEPEVKKVALSKDVALGTVEKADVQLFLTERVQVLAVEFHLSYAASIAEDLEIHLLAEGSCNYDIRIGSASDLKMGSIAAVDSQGERVSGIGANYIYAGTIGLGRGDVPYTLRTPLDL